MMVYKEPLNMKGRKILFVSDDMWVYIPSTKRPVRLTPSQRLLGQASNGDVLKIRLTTDYSPTLAGEEEFEGKNCFVLNLSAKKKSATYASVKVWIDKEDILKAEFFTLSKKKLKTAFYKEVKEFEGKKIISKVVIYDEILKDNWTEISILEMKTSEIPDKYFTKEYLERF